MNNGTIDSACINLAEGEVCYSIFTLSSQINELVQPLCLRIVGEDCTTVHVVATGDSCVTIDEAVGIDLQTLIANNPQLTAECTNIYPGEVIG